MDTSHLFSTALQLQSPWKVGSVDFRDADGGRQAWAVEIARHLTITHHKQRMFFLFASLLRILHSTCAKRWNSAKILFAWYLLGWVAKRGCDTILSGGALNVGIPPKFYLTGICLVGYEVR